MVLLGGSGRGSGTYRRSVRFFDGWWSGRGVIVIILSKFFSCYELFRMGVGCCYIVFFGSVNFRNGF